MWSVDHNLVSCKSNCSGPCSSRPLSLLVGNNVVICAALPRKDLGLISFFPPPFFFLPDGNHRETIFQNVILSNLVGHLSESQFSVPVAGKIVILLLCRFRCSRKKWIMQKALHGCNCLLNEAEAFTALHTDTLNFRSYCVDQLTQHGQ